MTAMQQGEWFAIAGTAGVEVYSQTSLSRHRNPECVLFAYAIHSVQAFADQKARPVGLRINKERATATETMFWVGGGPECLGDFNDDVGQGLAVRPNPARRPNRVHLERPNLSPYTVNFFNLTRGAKSHRCDEFSALGIDKPVMKALGILL
jgi:hypothetical protein